MTPAAISTGKPKNSATPQPAADESELQQHPDPQGVWHSQRPSEVSKAHGGAHPQHELLDR